MEFEIPEIQEKWSFIINTEIKDPDVVLKMPYPQFLQWVEAYNRFGKENK